MTSSYSCTKKKQNIPTFSLRTFYVLFAVEEVGAGLNLRLFFLSAPARACNVAVGSFSAAAAPLPEAAPPFFVSRLLKKSASIVSPARDWPS